MIFTTPQFALFFAIFLWGWTIAQGRGRKWLLLIASYLFYASWNPKFLILIIGSTLIDFYIGRRLAGSDDHRVRRRLVWISVSANLGALGVFKYFNFFIESAAAALTAIGLEASIPALEIILPVGISFYTFQTMSYTIDIYRRQLDPTDSLLDFSIYVAFFPQLVAGPIERARRLLPQIETLDEREADHTGWGLIAIGCFKKVVIADNIALLVDAAYADPSAAAGPALWIATYAFAVQIYCDFSGYSDIAVGLGRLMGIQLVQNFEAPYAAAGPSEFWRRWHISLSTWLRDYLYISLGGNRVGRWLNLRNLMLTMLLGGLWHGAAWNFILWGAWHGLLLVIFRPDALQALGETVDAIPYVGRLARWFRRLIFFHLVCIGWAFFRAETLSDCGALMNGMLNISRWDWAAWTSQVSSSGMGGWLSLSGVMMVFIIVAQMVWPVGSNQVVRRLWRAPQWARFAVVIVLLYCAMIAAPETPPPFIYFQF